MRLNSYLCERLPRLSLRVPGPAFPLELCLLGSAVPVLILSHNPHPQAKRRMSPAVQCSDFARKVGMNLHRILREHKGSLRDRS